MTSKTKKQDKKSKDSNWEVIEWGDHFSAMYDKGWSRGDSEPVIVRSIGYPFAETKKTVSLAQNINLDGPYYGNTITILKNCIVSRKRL